MEHWKEGHINGFTFSAGGELWNRVDIEIESHSRTNSTE